MATLQEIQGVLSGFPQVLSWAHFRTVPSSASPPHQAQSASAFSMGAWQVALEKGTYRVRGFRINVSVNTAASWSVSAARNNAALLRHEQGHYDITGLVARDLASSLLDLSLDEQVVAALKDSGTSRTDHMRYAQREFQKSVDAYGRQARELLGRLQTNPATRSDGIYDRQTQHGLNQAAQTMWDNRLASLKRSSDSFRLALSMAGVL